MTTDPKDAEIARLHKLWDDHDAAWSERVAVLTDVIARLTADLDWLKRSIFGSADYHPSLTIGCFAEMAQTTEAARKGGLDRAEKAEAERDAALAQVAMAYDTASQVEGYRYNNWGDKLPTKLSYSQQEAIRALTPADALAALSRRDAQMRAEGRKEGMREAARVVETLTGAVEGWSPQELIAVILAAAEKEAEK